MSRLFDAQGRPHKGAIPSPSPNQHVVAHSHRMSHSSRPAAANGFRAGTLDPVLRANPFPEVMDPFC
jgi:hypothetical protein